DAQSIEELTEVGQDFVDALYRHNKTDPPREIERVVNAGAIAHLFSAPLYSKKPAT
ncbi:MAG: hypothetical protein HN708_09700, partial [Candidatus Marinimicrobia bacterium]|nr:hypothetical protein [Candidatus Neomarinimicrobiota bacterium]